MVISGLHLTFDTLQHAGRGEYISFRLRWWCCIPALQLVGIGTSFFLYGHLSRRLDSIGIFTSGVISNCILTYSTHCWDRYPYFLSSSNTMMVEA